MALVEPRMISRMRADEERDWDIKKLSAICIALQLPPSLSLPLIEKAGVTFKPSEVHFIYQHVLTTRYNSTIHECNEFVAEAGLPYLSSKE